LGGEIPRCGSDSKQIAQKLPERKGSVPKSPAILMLEYGGWQAEAHSAGWEE